MSVEAPVLTVEEQQEKWLGEAQKMVRQHASQMKIAIDARNLQEVLKHSSQMLAELRTSALSPQNYYELYMSVCDEMVYLEQYFHEEVMVHGRKVEELYEIVQHAGNIVPRLYLLITVGAVYIKSKEAPAKDILKDLVEMCKGVQHPTRGLFLRHYLSSMTKNKLPDRENEYEGEGGTVQDSVEFVLQNFKEMVWLWVRMEHKQIVADPERRAKEREALKLLIGFNITRLGSLDGIDLEMYVESVMPRVIEVIANSKDTIAQQYLSEAMIQVFPDEFHLAKIDELLQMFCTQLMPTVDLQSILTSLMDRLGKYAVQVKESGEKKRKWERNALASMFDSFQGAINDLVQQKPDALNQLRYVHVMFSLLKLVLAAYPERYDRVNDMFAATAKHLEEMKLEPKTVNIVKQMLTRPVDHYGSMSSVLDLDGWPILLDVLDFKSRREVARDLCTDALKSGEPLSTVEHVAKFFEFIKPLVVPMEGDDDGMDDDFEEDQTLVAKMIHMFRNDSYDVQFKMYSATRKQFGLGGEARMKYTLAPLVFSFLRLAIKVKKATEKEEDVGKVTVEKILQYVTGTLEVLSRKYAKLALNIYVQAARVADRCDLGDICSNLLDKSFLLYEEEVCFDSKEQIAALPTLISCITSMKRMDRDNYDKFTTKLCSYSSKLLKKPDQCRAAFLCAHLYTKAEDEETRKKVLDYLKRSLTIVDLCSDTQRPPLFVDILNRYLYFFANHNENIPVKHINVLWELTSKNLVSDDVEDQPGLASPQEHYNNTVAYVKQKQQESDDGVQWAEVEVRT